MKNSASATPRRRSVIVAALACAIALPAALSGCDDRPATNEADGNSSSAPATSAPTNGQEQATFSPSTDLDDNGHWKGVTALDYVTLPEYEGIKVPKDQVTATDEEVQAQVDAIMANFATTERVTDRAIVDGDTVNIDYVGSIDGVEFAGGTTNNQGTTVTIGVTQYIDDFLEQLIGHKPGENFDIEVTFPEDYGNEELNGKDAVFNITVNHIQEQKVPELTDEWVEENLSASRGWKTVDEMRSAISEDLGVFNITVNHIQEQKVPELTDEWVEENLSASRGWKTVDEMRSAISEDLGRRLLSAYLQNQVIENATVSEIPEELISYQEQTAVAEIQNYASMYGFTLEDMLTMLTGYATTDEYLAANKDAIDATAKSYLVFQAIAEDADLVVTDEDVQAYFKNAMGLDNLDSLVQSYGMPYLKLVTLLDKVNGLILETAVVE